MKSVPTEAEDCFCSDVEEDIDNDSFYKSHPIIQKIAAIAYDTAMNNPVEKENSSVPSPSQTVPVNRTMVGVIALGCLVTSLGLLVFRPEDGLLRGSFTKVGLLVGAFWLALPTKNRSAAWAGISPQTLGSIALAVAAFFLKVPAPMIFVVWVVWWVIQFVLKPLPNGADGSKK